MNLSIKFFKIMHFYKKKSESGLIRTNQPQEMWKNNFSILYSFFGADCIYQLRVETCAPLRVALFGLHGCVFQSFGNVNIIAGRERVLEVLIDRNTQMMEIGAILEPYA
jgi:hypothetical protein